jgi:hypothetical protein
MSSNFDSMILNHDRPFLNYYRLFLNYSGFGPNSGADYPLLKKG